MKGKALNELTIDDLRAELSRRQRQLPALLRKQRKLQTALAKIDAQIATLKGAGKIKADRGARSQNKMPLADVIRQVMQDGKTRDLQEIVTGVNALGYRSSAAGFKVIVNQTLARLKKEITRVGRGRYAKKTAAKAEAKK